MKIIAPQITELPINNAELNTYQQAAEAMGGTVRIIKANYTDQPIRDDSGRLTNALIGPNRMVLDIFLPENLQDNQGFFAKVQKLREERQAQKEVK